MVDLSSGVSPLNGDVSEAANRTAPSHGAGCDASASAEDPPDHDPSGPGGAHGAFGRIAAAASIGLCFLGAMAAPADAARHHHSESASKPEAPKQPTGPLILAISISGQRVTVYDNGSPIASSPVSTGMSGHATPMGIFNVIQKQRWHHSNIYSGAPMPYMQRITWSGIALHAGVVPGHPASHGCIRLPERFAVRLYGMTKLGARVVITRGETAPYEINHPRLAELVKPPEVKTPEAEQAPNVAKPQGAGISPGAVVVATTGVVTASDAHPDHSEPAGHEAAGSPQAAAEPGKAGEPGKTTDSDPATNAGGDPAAAPPAPPPPPGEDVLKRPGQLSLFISRREGKLFVRKGFTPAFDVPVTIAQPEKPFGTHVFTASSSNDGNGTRWLGISVSDRQSAPGGSGRGKHKGREARAERPAPMTGEALRQSAIDALDRIELPAEALARITPLVTSGTSLVVSDQGLGGETGKETDFIVVTK